MRHNRLALYVHLVWATYDRLPMITPDIERRLHRQIESGAVKQQCMVLALNGIADHIHVVLVLPTTITIAGLVKQLKGVSSHFVNEALRPEMPFKWQGSYGAFTVSRWDVDRVVAYVKRQKQHHAAADLLPEWEETFEEIQAGRVDAH
jgi:putative transposase